MYHEKIQLLISDKAGRIYPIPGLEPAGMKAGHFFRLTTKDLIELPFGSELFMLPERIPVGYDRNSDKFVKLESDPFSKKKARAYPVAAFVSPGFTTTHNSAYSERGKPKLLPLFSYAAVCLYRDRFYASCVRVDREKRQDLRGMDVGHIRKNTEKFRKLFPANRLITHLSKCALCYSCPAAKNFFLHRYEAPLPTSPFCNSRCIGCISYQPRKRCPITQPRITFVPSPEEIKEVALFHIQNTPNPVVSFGQGCEGEPLLVGDTIEKAVKLIRENTRKGVINLNTNASMPGVIARLFDAGLDSIRVSINSAREKYYARYYKPRLYSFEDVKQSIREAKRARGFVSMNYLVMPGFTDSDEEIKALRKFIETSHIDMIQWRNLNYDPLRYFRDLGIAVKKSAIRDIRALILSVKRDYPHLMNGYYNPSRRRIAK